MLENDFFKFIVFNFFILVSVLFLTFVRSVFATEQDIYFSGTLLEDAVECTIIGGGNSIIDFGEDVYIANIDGVSYKKTPMPVSIRCNDDSDGIVEISFEGAGVGSGCDVLLCTSIEGLGLQLYAGEKKINLGKVLYSELINGNVDSPSFYAVPVKINDASLKSGDFFSVVTMIVGIL